MTNPNNISPSLSDNENVDVSQALIGDEYMLLNYNLTLPEKRWLSNIQFATIVQDVNQLKCMYHPSHIDFRAGYWKLNVYRDGGLIHSFDDRSGDIFAALKCLPSHEESDFLDDLIDEVQRALDASGQRKLNNEEVGELKSKMLDIDNLQDET